MFKFVAIIVALVGQNPQPVPVAKLEVTTQSFQTKAECEQFGQEFLTKNRDAITADVIKQFGSKPVGAFVQCTDGSDEKKDDSI